MRHTDACLNVAGSPFDDECICPERHKLKMRIMAYIRENIFGGTRWTNIESMFMALGVKTSDELYMEREKIVSELINTGELKTFTEPWRDYCWLIPADFDHLARFKGTAATVECEPFGYGYDKEAR